MAGHAQLKFVMTEYSKTQIRLTGLIIIILCVVFYPLQGCFLKNMTEVLFSWRHVWAVICAGFYILFDKYSIMFNQTHC